MDLCISVKFYEIPKLLFEIFPRQRRLEYIDTKIVHRAKIFAKFYEIPTLLFNVFPRKGDPSTSIPKFVPTSSPSSSKLQNVCVTNLREKIPKIDSKVFRDPRSILRNTNTKSFDKATRRRMATKFHFHRIRSNPAGGRSTRSLPS